MTNLILQKVSFTKTEKRGEPGGVSPRTLRALIRLSIRYTNPRAYAARLTWTHFLPTHPHNACLLVIITRTKEAYQDFFNYSGNGIPSLEPTEYTSVGRGPVPGFFAGVIQSCRLFASSHQPTGPKLPPEFDVATGLHLHAR